MFWVFVLWKVVATTAGIVLDVRHLILIVFVDLVNSKLCFSGQTQQDCKRIRVNNKIIFLMYKNFLKLSTNFVICKFVFFFFTAFLIFFLN